MSLCPFGHHKLIIYLFSIQLSDVVLVLLSKIRSTSDLRLRSKTTGSILLFCNSKGSGYTSNSYKLLLRTYLFLKMPRSIIVGCGILNYLQKQIFSSQFFFPTSITLVMLCLHRFIIFFVPRGVLNMLK